MNRFMRVIILIFICFSVPLKDSSGLTCILITLSADFFLKCEFPPIISSNIELKSKEESKPNGDCDSKSYFFLFIGSPIISYA